MDIFWHRRDLRVSDNHGLALAAGIDGEDDDESDRHGPALPVFVFDDEVLEYAGSPRVRFMLDALDSLRERYHKLGSDLLVARGDPRDVLPDLALDQDADRVVWNRDYSGLARERDEAVRRALSDAGVAHASVHDAILHEPGSITTTEGDPYSVYSYFWKKWRDRPKAGPYPTPTPGDLVPVTGDPLPSIDQLGFDDPEADLQRAGTDAARERLDAFCSGPIYRYDEDRDYPAANATSRLSPHLKWGTIGIRDVYRATVDAMETARTDAKRTSVEEFRSQLAWREFYAHVLRFSPSVVSENYRDFERPIEWRDDPEALDRWKAGTTGYPIVDAGMRQLRAEAHVHNRVRMIVASFLTKDLLIDWREGYAWFREMLADHDAANDAGGWQWAGSTGTDAQPYFRIFNPTTQGERYDPDAEYVREYVPELRGVGAETIHSWPALRNEQRAERAPDYPAPIVDHAERREAAIDVFERARGATSDEE